MKWKTTSSSCIFGPQLDLSRNLSSFLWSLRPGGRSSCWLCDRYFWRIISFRLSRTKTLSCTIEVVNSWSPGTKNERKRIAPRLHGSQATAAFFSSKFNGQRWWRIRLKTETQQWLLCRQFAAQIYNIWHAIMEMNYKIILESPTPSWEIPAGQVVSVLSLPSGRRNHHQARTILQGTLENDTELEGGAAENKRVILSH